MPNCPLGSRAAGDGRACPAGARAVLGFRGGAIVFPPSSPTAKKSPSRVTSRSLARGRYTARGARPSLNPAPAEVHAGPSANAVGGSASVRSNRRHTTASMGGGACDALATWPHATYPGGGTGRQKLAVPPFLRVARHPESRHARSYPTGAATGRGSSPAPSSRRTRRVDAGGSSAGTATSPREHHPGGHIGRHTLRREFAPEL